MGQGCLILHTGCQRGHGESHSTGDQTLMNSYLITSAEQVVQPRLSYGMNGKLRCQRSGQDNPISHTTAMMSVEKSDRLKRGFLND